MRILIINAHPSSHEGQKAFNRFFDCMKEALKIYKDFLDVEGGCLVRSKDDIDDFLFGESGTYSSLAAAKRFDALDMIIISGDASVLPWSRSAAKMLVLIRMCIQVKKCLFACGTAMDALVYLSASNLDSAIRVINGNGKGSKLGDMNTVVIPQTKLGEIDCFLDATTGDLYTLRHQSNEWLPLCNIGLHNIRVAQEYNTLGKYVIQVPVYRPNKVIENRTQNNRFYESHEILCYIKKHHSNHWLFAGCALEFIVPHKSKWQVHSFTFTNRDKTFEVIADSKEGPMIIEYPNIIGVKFDLDRKYPESLKMLGNFLTKYSKDIMGINRRAVVSIKKELEVKYDRMSQIVFTSTEKPKLTSSESVCSSDRGFNTGAFPIKVKDKDRDRDAKGNAFLIRHVKNNSMGTSNEHEELRHSGYAMKKSGIRIYEHNYIAPGKVPLEAQQNSPVRHQGNKQTNVSVISSQAPAPEVVNVNKGILIKRQASTAANSPRSQRTRENDLKDTMSTRRFYRNMSTGEFDSLEFIDEKHEKYFNQQDSMDFDGADNVVTKELARKVLYPDLPDLNIGFEKRSWVPGSLSSRRRREETSEEKNIKVVKVDCGREYRPKTSRLLTSKDVRDTNPYKTLRASCPYQSPYDISKEHEKKERAKIIGNKVFVTSLKMGQSPRANYSSMQSRMSSTTGFNQKNWS